MTEQRLQPPYDPSCVECRRDAGKDSAGTTWQCVGHVYLERDRLRADLAQARAERDEARKDAAFHADCRPNRRQAEAAMADAKATNDRWADEVWRREEAEATIATLRADLEHVREERAIAIAKIEEEQQHSRELVKRHSDERHALRAALTAAQELLELPETCVVCSAILEPREDEAPHCYDCVVTDEHEAERQDRITQLEIALAQAAPAQASGL